MTTTKRSGMRIVLFLFIIMLAVIPFAFAERSEAASKPKAPAKVRAYKHGSTQWAYWSKVKGAAGYQLKAYMKEYEESGKYVYYNATLKTTKTSTDYMEILMGEPVILKIKVRAYKKSAGKTVYGSWSKWIKAKKVHVTKPSALQGVKCAFVKSVKNAEGKVTKNIYRISWNKQKKAAGYQIRVNGKRLSGSGKINKSFRTKSGSLKIKVKATLNTVEVRSYISKYGNEWYGPWRTLKLTSKKKQVN